SKVSTTRDVDTRRLATVHPFNSRNVRRTSLDLISTCPRNRGRPTITTGPLAGQAGLGIPIETCTLWAPACTFQLFKQSYLPVLAAGGIKKLALFTLTDKAEQDDNCAEIYHKSLLYLVSNAFEDHAHIPAIRDGEPILGMQKFIEDERQDPDVNAAFQHIDLVRS